MIITKYTHACFTVEKDNQVLVIDPGVFSENFIPSERIVGVVVTHEHSDHFDPDQLTAIFAANPHATLVAAKEIIEKVPDYPSRAVTVGDQVSLGAFELEFFGGTHAEIHASFPLIQNLGVLINHGIYYPGDSFALPNRPIDILALPAAAPWAKISESIDFLLAVKPRLAFPTHDAILSDTGQEIADRMLASRASTQGISYQRIDGHPLEVA